MDGINNIGNKDEDDDRGGLIRFNLPLSGTTAVAGDARVVAAEG